MVGVHMAPFPYEGLASGFPISAIAAPEPLTGGQMGNVVRLIPALVVTEDEMATGLNRFEAALTSALG